MSFKTIYIITCGEVGEGPNPGLTANGQRQIQALRKHLPEIIAKTVVGEGLRHSEMIKLLGLDFTKCEFSLLAGTATITNQKEGGEIRLSHGALISPKQWWIPDNIILRDFKRFPNKSIVLTEKSHAAIFLKFVENPPSALDACIYKITIESSQIIDIKFQEADIA